MKIILTLIILSAIGLISGVLLSVVAVLMSVKKDEKAEAIEGVLPGVNCGACGFSGCSGYAEALSNGETTNTTMCSTGGADKASEVAKILGVESGKFNKKVAIVRCQGSWDVSNMKMEYKGLESCSAANQLFMGFGACQYGCIGYGDCASVCEYDAITVDNGVAKIDECKCTACGKCVKSCPKGIIELVPSEYEDRIVLCLNRDKGAKTRIVCNIGCIGCLRCVKKCEYDAITVDNNLARIDYDKCTGCGECEKVCPQNCIAFFVSKCNNK